MRSQLRTCLTLLLFIAALPAHPDDAAQDEPIPEEDSFMGEWYVQLMEGEVTPLDEPVRLVFEKTGIVRVFEDDDEEEVAAYTYDKAKSTITIVEQDDPTDVEAIIKYSFVDDMLVMRMTEGGGGDEEEIIELTRKPEGAKRHQKMREKRGEVRPGSPEALAKQAAEQLRMIHQGAVTYANGMKDERYPSSMGQLVVGDFITPEYVLSPYSKQLVAPKDFDDWKNEKKIEWVNRHTGYVYLLAGKTMEFDIDLIAVFELPLQAKQKQVRLLYEDNHFVEKPYAEADKLIKKQTGHAIADWMKTTSPGTGEMVLPKKQADEPKRPVEE